jgi:histidine decarboxylase
MVESRLSPSDQERLDKFFGRLSVAAETSMGYPVNTLFDFSELDRFWKFSLNNVGDPYIEGTYHLNSHQFEREVLDYFFGLTGTDSHRSWGYVTSGGTEGNLYGIFLGRELYPHGILFYSEDTHYSVSKIQRCLQIRSIMIRSTPSGAMDLADLRETLKIHRDTPPIILLNVGTTMKGAIDDLAGIQAILKDLAIHNFYLHADAALHGMILPFVDSPPKWNIGDGAHSLSISGHKMVGSPMPCGVAIAMRANVERISRSVEYVGSVDTTITGSRNGLTPLILWYTIRSLGTVGLRDRIRGCLETADYAVKRLNDAGCNAWKNPNSPIVVFDRPPAAIVDRWQLATQHELSHIVTMPNIRRELVDRLADEILAWRNSPNEAHYSGNAVSARH